MTYEQIIEELKRLKSHNIAVPSEEQAEIDANVNNEVEELEATIVEYNEKISALEAKIADESNYQYNSNEERDLTVEILDESFANQLEVMAREDEEYRVLQEIGSEILNDYDLEIASLNEEIEAIERRLRKNDIAVSKNIGIRLTEEELNALNLDLEQKRNRIKRCEELKTEYVEELRNYDELTTINNQKREIVLSKQQSLSKIKEHRATKVGSIDNAKLRNDKDELASLKAGVAALISRKDFITYNPNAEIDKLIAAIEENKVQENEIVEENKDVNIGFIAPGESVIDEVNLDAEIKPEDTLETQVDEPTEDKAQTLINAYIDGNEDLVEEKEKDESTSSTPLGIPEETTGHDFFLAGNPDLDIGREAEIEEASEILKEKKKEGWFKRNWKKWVAAGLATIALIAALKGCDPKTNKPAPEDLSNNNISQSQTDEGITEDKEKEFDEKFEFAGDNSLDGESNDNTNNITPDPEPEVDPTPNPTPEPTPEPEVEPTPDPVPDPIPDPIPDPTPEPTVETGEIELEQGESVISAEDILNGNVNEDTVIEHGDEVGKTTDNAELKDYTEEGKAVVEYEKNEEKPSTTTSKEDIIKNLEEFMGGDLTFTDEGNQWLDQMSGKTR